MRRRVLIFWRRTVVVRREEPKPSFPPFGYPPPYQPVKWGLWRRIKYRVTGKGFPPYVPGVVRRERVTLRRRFVLLFSRKPPVPPPRPVLVTAVAVGTVRTGARRDPWRWWMLFTRRGADMTVWEWIENKRADVMEWPVTWKLGMALPGIFGGWLVSLQMGWHPRYCMFVGGVLGVMSPFISLFLLEGVFLFIVFGVFFGLIYWAFGDVEFVRQFYEDTGKVLGVIWSLIVKLWHAIFG